MTDVSPEAEPTELLGGPRAGTPPVPLRWNVGLPLAGAVIGCLGAVCGIGGGLIATPILNLGVGLPLPSAIATSLVLVLATALAATVTEALSPDSALVWPVAAALAGGAFLGARAGYGFVQRLGAARLAWFFGVFLFLAGLRMLVGGGATAADGTFEVGAGTLAIAFCVGLLGGTVAPMLGIGGGIVMVPGLALLVHGLGFESARACALAAATVGASRSVLLYARRMRVQWRFGLLLAAGSLVGAAVGVQLAHLEGAAAIGKRMLGVLVLFVSLRYLVGAWRARGVTSR